MKMYRCKMCGYLHLGSAPERCPVCGAPSSAFSEYEGPGDLTGSKTLENLKAAFAGESQANRRYTLWRHIAELESAPQSALDAFDRAATEETAHALGHLVYMGGFGTTADNLRAAAAGEEDEASSMYPEFAEIAEAEGHAEIAQYFRAVGRFEAQHRDGYKKALADLGE